MAAHEQRTSTKALLADLRALEMLIDGDRFETGVRRIGAEQEMFLVDAFMHPAPVAVEVKKRIADNRITYELARFNLEANASPLVFEGDCLRRMHREIASLVGIVRTAARLHNADVVLAGILPTLRKSHLSLDNLTPGDRYRMLNDACRSLRGGDFQVSIKGLDELHTQHDNVMLESSTASFQLHLQVAPCEFAALYNIAQAITAPVLATAANSAVFLGRRLWHETRVALFEEAVDTRSSVHQTRGCPPRVDFGRKWMENSVLELYRDQVARFRVMLPTVSQEDPVAVATAGRLPRLAALQVHNGTVWSWNRACYGVADGVAHLRIENRALPAGPTIADETANAAFYYGLMAAAGGEYGDVTKRLSFDDAKANFFAAARRGLQAQLTWMNGRTYAVCDLVDRELLPLARAGLKSANIVSADIDEYLGIIDERVRRRTTGAKWAVDAFSNMPQGVTRNVCDRAITDHMLRAQRRDQPVHTWEPCALREDLVLRESYRLVGQFMSTDLFTVRPDDLVELAASVMEWRHVKHVPVEDDQGHLIGLITYRMLLRLVSRDAASGVEAPQPVSALMKRDPVTVSPETPTLTAMRIMRERGVGCLPVVVGRKLVGVITQTDLIRVSTELLENHLGDP